MPDEFKMTRTQMQDQTLVIESLLSTAMAMSSRRISKTCLR